MSLEGPCALVTSTDSIIDIAKLLVTMDEEIPNLTLKNAMLDGEPSLFAVEQLSKMRSRTELLGEVASLLLAPAGAIAGCLGAPQSKIAGCLKTLAAADEAA